MSSEHDKERAKAILELAEHGWTVAAVSPKRGYTTVTCGCGRHIHWLPKTPKYSSTFRRKAASFTGKAVVSMDLFLVTWPGVLEVDAGQDAEELLGAVMDELLACDEVDDPSIGYDRETHVAEFEVIVEAVDPLDCVRKASGLIRSAIHGAGIATPGWPDADELKPHAALRFEQGPKLEPVAA